MKMQFDRNRESELISQAVSGDHSALETLLTIHRPFVYSMANRFCCWRSMHEELQQAGLIGLYKAILHYRPENGTRLLTYALPWILGEMKKAMAAEYITLRSISMDAVMEDERACLPEALAGREAPGFGYIDLHRSIEKLEEDERMLICLRYYRDRSQTETALLMKKSQTQISRLERKTLDKLSRMLS